VSIFLWVWAHNRRMRVIATAHIETLCLANCEGTRHRRDRVSTVRYTRRGRADSRTLVLMRGLVSVSRPSKSDIARHGRILEFMRVSGCSGAKNMISTNTLSSEPHTAYAYWEKSYK